MREYETVFILKNELEDEKAIAFCKNMMELVSREGGKHLKLTNWGRKKIAWERDRHQKGMYVQHVYLGRPGLVEEYERNLKIREECILRQTVVLDKRVNEDARQPEEDVLQPPVHKEREERRPRDDRDRGDRRDRDDRDREPRRDERAESNDY